MPNRVGVDPETGRFTLDGQVLDRNDPRLWGNAGRFLWGGNEQGMDNENSTQMSDDPRYFQRVGSRNIGGGDSGEQMQDVYGLRPEVAQRLNGRVQISQSGIGGWNEVIDPSKVEYDEEFGFVTDPHNIKRGDPQDDRQAMITAFAIPAAIAGGVAMAHSAAVGGFSGAGATGSTYIPAGEGDAAAVNAGLTSTPGSVASTGATYIPAGEGDAAAVNAGLTSTPGNVAATAGPGSYIPAGEGDVAAVNSGLTSTPAVPPAGAVPSPTPAAPIDYSPLPNIPQPGPMHPMIDPSSIIANANPGLFSRLGNWWDGLTPTSQRILGLGASQLAGSAFQANAQRNNQEFQREQANQAEQDRIRRGQIPSFGSAFKPKNPATPKSTVGIIDSRRRG